MTHRLLVGLAPLVALTCALGCGGHASGDGHASNDGAATPAACSTIAPPLDVQYPHVDATGSIATAIEQALTAIFAAQSPPFSPGPTYAISSLDCGDVEPPMGASGYECTLQVQGGAQPVAITLDQPSTLAQNLFNALLAAGSSSCDQGYGPHVVAANMSVGGSQVQYDDTATFGPFPAPNVSVRGADATSVVSAFAAAGIDDCDATRYVFLVCTAIGGPPTCSYQWMPLVASGSAEAFPVCMGSVESPGGSVTATASLAVWQAILAAAGSAGFQPSSGTLAQTTVINARYFTWDGTTLTFTLVQGNATPP